MDSLPDELFRMLDQLPLVDAYRLRRVSRSFNRLLFRAPTELELDFTEIWFQLKEREISIKLRGFKDVVRSILTSSGMAIKILRIFHPYRKLTGIGLIAKSCPNLEELELMHLDEDMNNHRQLSLVRFSDLAKLRRLRKLKAELLLTGYSSADAAVVAERLQAMEEVSRVRLEASEIWFLDLASQIPGLKELECDRSVLDNVGIDGAGVNWTGFSKVEGAKFTVPTHAAILHLLPESLKMLNLKGISITMDVSVLRCLPCLTTLRLNRVAVSSYDFLQFCRNLKSLDVIFCEPEFDQVALSHIPENVTLHHIGIGRHAKLDAALLDSIQSRNWPLSSIFFTGGPGKYPGSLKSLVGLLHQCGASLHSIRVEWFLPDNSDLLDHFLDLLGDRNAFPRLSHLTLHPMFTAKCLRRFFEQRAVLAVGDGRSFGKTLEEGAKAAVSPVYLVGDLPLLRVKGVLDEAKSSKAVIQLSKKANVIFVNYDN